jgi:alkylation response protein AidB-like acyl-CoA dehydrogenase
MTATNRAIFREEHRLFRETCRRFMEREVAPHHAKWEEEGQVSREVWLKAGQAGLLLPTTSAEYGGGGGDFPYAAVLIEEISRVNGTGLGFGLHNDIVAPYIETYGSEDLKRHWLPKMAAGTTIGAICMTEPGTGSDLQGVKTTAIRDGNHYVVNGQKTFITNGQMADLYIVVAKTDPSKGAKGTSLILVEGDRPGFTRGRKLKKMGLKAQDTSELFFDRVRVPATNLLGEESQGFRYLMEQLPRERLLSAIRAAAAAEMAVEWTVNYTREREAFGKKIFEFQNTQFKLAEMKTQAVIGRVFVDHCIEQLVAGKLDLPTAAIAKLWMSEMQGRVVDEGVQLHGGYGYMWEFPITQLYADSRIQRIFAGTSEIMKLIIARSL